MMRKTCIMSSLVAWWKVNTLRINIVVPGIGNQDCKLVFLTLMVSRNQMN